MSRNLLDQLSPLLSGGVVNTTLKNAAAVAMSADGDTVSANGIEDELLRIILERA